jgi:hypothetical protein
VEKGSLTAHRTEREEKGAAHRGGKERCPRKPEHRWRRWPPVVAGEGMSPAGSGNRQRERARWWEKSEPLARMRAGGLFFKMRYGRTGQSTVPVRCTPDSAQENRFIARDCRCTGHCTVQCPVHTGLSGEPRQRRVWKILNFSI